MSNGFFKELEDALDNEWISMQDICAIFAGFCPIEPYQSNYGRADPNRRYKRISDGEVVKLSQSDVKGINRYLDSGQSLILQIHEPILMPRFATLASQTVTTPKSKFDLLSRLDLDFVQRKKEFMPCTVQPLMKVFCQKSQV